MVISRDPLGHVNDLVQQGRLPEARDAIGKFLAAAPAHAEALHLAGMVELMSGAPAAAVAFLRRCVEAAPAVPFAWSNLGVALNAAGDFTNALGCFERTLQLQPGNAAALKNQGIALRRLGRHDDAMTSFRRSAQREPNDAELHREVGDLLVDMGRFDEALARYDRALAASPRDAAAHHNRGFAAWRAGRADRAVEDIGRALALSPGFARAHSTLGAILAGQGLAAQSAESHARAVALEPREPAFHNGLGIALYMLQRYDDAIAAYDRALEIDPDHVDALENRGAASHEAGRHAEALASHERAAMLAPDLPYNPGHRLYTRLELCDWAGYEEVLAQVVRQLEDGRLASQPLPLLSVPVPARLQRRCAELYARDVLRNAPPAKWDRAPIAHERIRVGYFSAEFHEHPVAQLLAPLVERHDRARFEVTAFAFGPATGDAMRRRLEAAFERFEDVRARSDAGIAALARERGIDIAIDLMGFTGRARTGIFGHRAAPVQAQFLGYAGTMGTSSIDYLLADATAVPEAHRAHFTEKIVALPDTCLVNDPGRAIAAETPARAGLGLPENAFVFCCFCNRAKITPDAFDAWMRLLGQVKGSVLWLARPPDAVAARLRSEVQRRGIDPARLVFAPRVALQSDHLARLAAAGLFLDTFHYNGHVTTSDALYAGLPVVTVLGDTFASRMASSLLRAAGLPELVATSREEYEGLALRLAGDRAALGELRTRLASNRATHPVFDATRFARNVERAFERMVERHRAGLPPDHIDI